MALVKHRVARTDCLDIRTEFEAELTVFYSNPTDFDDIPYSSFESVPTFNLLILGRLNYHDPRIVQESESMSESDGDVESLLKSSKEQIMLQVEKLPAFMRKKLESVLDHVTLTIDGNSFTKEEPYEVGARSLQYPFRPSTCWLTVRGSYKTNVQ